MRHQASGIKCQAIMQLSICTSVMLNLSQQTHENMRIGGVFCLDLIELAGELEV